MTDTDPAPSNENGIRTSRKYDTVRSATRLVATAVALVFLLYLVTVLPGVDRLVPATPVSIAAVASAIVSLAVAGLLVYVAPKLAALTRAAIDRGALVDPADAPARTRGRIAENAAGVVHWLVALAAVIVVHRGAAGVTAPLLGDVAWAYDGAFLLVALVPVVFVAARLAATVDPLSTLVADRVVGEPDDGGAPDDGGDPAAATATDRGADEE